MSSEKATANLKMVAKISLIVLSVFTVGQLAGVYQTRYQLVSPLIPEKTIWAINKQFVFAALVASSAGVIALLLYFFEKYLFVIILIGLTLMASEIVYV